MTSKQKLISESIEAYREDIEEITYAIAGFESSEGELGMSAGEGAEKILELIEYSIIEQIKGKTIRDFIEFIHKKHHERALGFVGKLAWADVRDNLCLLAEKYYDQLKESK
jgi:hypothetical protein